MAKCSQCGNNAMVQVEGHLLCLRCYETWQRLLREQMDAQARMINYLNQMETTVGMPGILPRIQLPEASTINTGPMTLNNIYISDSIVGVINTGQIQQLDLAMDTVRDSGQEDLAEALRQLSQAVIDATDLAAEQKNAAVEHLAFLAEQASLPKEQRRHSLGRTVIIALEHVLTAAASVMTLWPTVRPLLEKLFQ